MPDSPFASRTAQTEGLIVVTDLDGTLLDHHDYSYDAVLPVLERLKSLGVPVVANTSKTQAEWLAMRAQFANADAFVVENGSAVYLPDGSAQIHGVSREHILEFLTPLKMRFRFEGFADWSLDQIVEYTGLDAASAELSSDRSYSEPLIWSDSAEALEKFKALVTNAGLMWLQGGRFLHVLGDTNKARPFSTLRDIYGKDRKIVALGDNQNDLAMLEAADYPILLALAEGKEDLKKAVSRLPQGRVSDFPGPEGWAIEVSKLLHELY